MAKNPLIELNADGTKFWQVVTLVDGNGQEITIGGAATGVQETPTKTTVSSSGSVAAGARSATLITSGDFAGTILTDTAQASGSYTFTASAGNTLAAIAYTVTSGSIEILKTV